MNRRRVTVAAAAAGVVAGAAGLGALAMPAGAGPSPTLPDVSAQSLVQSVLTAKPVAFGGTVDVNNDLGIPAIAGIPQLSSGASKVRMWTDGQGKVRVSLPGGQSERTFVDDGTTGWMWNSADHTVKKFAHGDEKPGLSPEQATPTDPVTASQQVVSAIEKTSTVTVDGTARVANRSAYELVLAPKPGERTVLREIRVAVDSEMHIPLRLSVLTNGTTQPAVEVGFSDLNVGQQDASLFQFTPPAGAKVEQAEPNTSPDAQTQPGQAAGDVTPQVVGDGWDTVVVAKMPKDALANLRQQDQGGSDGSQVDVPGLLKQVGKPVSGAWGSGTLITTKVGGALIADDGRVAAGAVPEQVLVEAIGQAK
jgi:outer membrane lipoprotein-sorting protein